MGNFANTLFSSLLGWLRGAAAWLWSFINNPESGGMIVWIADNWLTLIILLCAVCMLIDFIVYLIRWRPYKVWASFFRRLRGRSSDETDTGRIRRRWIHADGTTSVEVVDAAEGIPEPMDPLVFAMPSETEGFADPYPRFEQPAAAPLSPVDFAEEEESPETVTRPSRSEERRRLFAEPADELPLRYAPPPAATEDAPAYHEPYYPPQWKRPTDTGASGIDVGGSGL